MEKHINKMENQIEKMDFVVLSFYVDIRMGKFFSFDNEEKRIQISNYCFDKYLDLFQEIPKREILSEMFLECLVLEKILRKFYIHNVEKM